MATARATQPAQEELSSDLQLEELAPQVPQVQQRQEVALTSSEDNFLQKLITSGKLPGHVRTVEDAFTIGKMGKELGFPIMQSFHWIIPIQGKLTLAAKAIGALMRKNKVTMKTIEDGVYVYNDNSTSEYPRPVSTPPLPGEKPVDRRTTILFTRDGIEEKVSFSWIDATNQGLTTKDNWKRMPKEMLWARCLSKGANRVGSDFLLGLYSTDEMFDTLGTPSMQVSRDEDGTINQVITPHEVIPNPVAVAA